jgi:hypothetical protein
MGIIGPEAWNWMKITLIIGLAFFERTPVRACAEKAFIAHFPVDVGGFLPDVFYTIQSDPDQYNAKQHLPHTAFCRVDWADTGFGSSNDLRHPVFPKPFAFQHIVGQQHCAGRARHASAFCRVKKRFCQGKTDQYGGGVVDRSVVIAV